MFAFNLNNNNKNNNNHHHLRFCLLLKFFEFFIVFFLNFFLVFFQILHWSSLYTHTKIIHRFIIHTRISIIQSSHRNSNDHFSLSLALNTLNEKARWESVDDPGRFAMTMVLKTFLLMRYISILSLSLVLYIYYIHMYIKIMTNIWKYLKFKLGVSYKINMRSFYCLT